jgi:hypothetical protein
MPIKSDPHRLPPRNHNQEGPGFLFVATQCGRPVIAGDHPSVAYAVLRTWARPWSGSPT